MIINSRFFNRSELIGFATLALLLFVILPLSLDVFRLNLVAKYLTYAFVAIGLVAAIAWQCTSNLRRPVSRTPRSSRPPASPTSWTGIS
jgi:cell division protein FtsW (lipid II flippase)